jgi:hypothetical protein
LKKYVDILTETSSYKWSDGHNELPESSEGHAFLFAIAASGEDIGPELWRIGLIPDLGEIDVATRIRANRHVVKTLCAPVGRRDVANRLSSAGVKLTPVTRQVAAFL